MTCDLNNPIFTDEAAAVLSFRGFFVVVIPTDEEEGG